MKKETLNAVIAALGTCFTALFGAWDTAIGVLILFMVLDYITGFLGGVVNKTLSSAVGFKGLLKKFTILVVLIVAVSLDRLLNSGSWVFRTLVCYFYIANEGISLIENAAKIGLPVPDKLLTVLAQLKDKSNPTDSQKTSGSIK
jgi:toxin secretion/phage lysis holin